MGYPEAGNDPLFQALHADHEMVNQLFEQILAEDVDPDQAIELWSQLSVALTARTMAETEIVYDRLAHRPETKTLIPHAIEEHNEVEKMMAEADAMVAGTDEFFALVTDIAEAVQHHVDSEEGEILPNARKTLSDQEANDLVQRFQARKQEIMPQVEQELEPVIEQERQVLESGDLEDVDDAEPDFADDDGDGQSKSSSSKGQSKASGSSARSSGGKADLQGKSVKELQELARDKGIEGRSKMSKDELIQALSRR
jgi:hypothetical protein